MIRKISRNSIRWLNKAIWKLIKNICKTIAKVFWRPQERTATPAILKASEDRAQAPPEPVAEGLVPERDGNHGIALLKPSALNLEPLVPMLQERGPHSNHDVVAFVIGTPMQMLVHFHDFIVVQRPDTNSIAILAGATSTDGDDVNLTTRQLHYDPWERRIEGDGPRRLYVDWPATHRIISRKIGNIVSSNGNGGDQLKADRDLQTDPRTAPDIQKFVGDCISDFTHYDALACALITIEGGGGTAPLHWFGVDLLKAKLRVNRHYRLLLLPTEKEELHIPNMRGTLASIIASEDREDDSEESPTLYLLRLQERSGPHDTDIAVVAGVVTLSGNTQNRDRGEEDSTNKFNHITKTVGNWLTVHPRLVEIPLRPMGELEYSDGAVFHDYRYHMSLRD